MSNREPIAQDPSMPAEWLLGQPCWGFVAGAGTGSVVDLNFGRKLRLARASKNPHLADDLRTHEGEISLFVECKWALRYRGKLVCDSNSDNTAGGKMLRGLQRMVGATVREIVLTVPPKRLVLNMTKDLSFSITAGPQGGGDRADNYTLFVPGMSFTVGPDLKLRTEPRPVVVAAIGRKYSSLTAKSAG